MLEKKRINVKLILIFLKKINTIYFLDNDNKTEERKKNIESEEEREKGWSDMTETEASESDDDESKLVIGLIFFLISSYYSELLTSEILFSLNFIVQRVHLKVTLRLLKTSTKGFHHVVASSIMKRKRRLVFACNEDE